MSEARRWQVSIIGQGEVDPRTLTLHPLNPKVHPPEQDAVVEASIRQLGWLKRVMVNVVTGRVLDGNERVALAVRRGERTIPVDYVEVPEELEGMALLTLDASAALAKPQLERWVALRKEAAGRTQEAALLGFWSQLAAQYKVVEPDEGSEPEARRESWADVREEREAGLAQEAEAVRREWGVELGQCWRVGRHVVWCGDSLSAEVQTRLIGSEVVDVVVTSPPYAVDKGYEHGAGPGEHRHMLRRLAEWSQAVVRPGGFVVVNFADLWAQRTSAAWTGSERACCYPMAQEYWQVMHDEWGWDLYAQRVWVKAFARLRQPLWTYHTSLAHQQEWEHIWTWRLPGGVGEAVYDWGVSVHAVWDSGKELLERDGSSPWSHWSAGYPSYIPKQVLRAHSAPGAVVWEPFLGSGTTVLACEELDRKCLGSDRDPAAIALTLQRFYEATGERPHPIS